MKNFLLLMILFCGAFLLNACGDDNPGEETKEDLGGETTGIIAKDFVLSSEANAVEFSFCFDMTNETTKKDYDNIKKLGYKVVVGQEETSFEVDFVKNTIGNNYQVVITDSYENNYSDDITVKLYYVFTNEKGNDKQRYSKESFTFNFYELAKVTNGQYAESILQKCEPNKVVRVELIYNDEEFTISTSSLDCAAEIVALEDNNVIIKVTTTKTFSDNVRMYFNGKLSSGFVNNGTTIEYTTRTENVTEVDITVDFKEYQVTSEETELYKAYVKDETGSDTIKVIIELKDNNKLAPLAKVSINGEYVEVENYEAGSYVVTFKDERVTSINVDFDMNTFETANASDKYDIVIGRDDDYDDILVKITSKDDNEFSKRIKLVVNSVWYELTEESYVTYTDKEITIKVTDNRITKVYIDLACWDLDPKDYSASTTATEYIVVYIPDKNLEYIYVKVTCIDNYTFSNDVKVYINNSPVKSTLYKLNSSTEIMFTMDDPNWTGIF